MRNPKRLASGVLEGELKEDHKLQKNGAMFLLEAGVVVVARGSAVGRVRAMVTKSASPPAPLPIADDVDQWTYTATLRPELHWLLSNGVRLELHPHRTEREAQDDVEELERRLFGGRRAWRNGNDVYVFNPK